MGAHIFEQSHGAVPIAPGKRVAGGVFDLTLLLKPGGRAAMQRGELGSADHLLKPIAQDIGEQMVIAIPLSHVIQSDDEEPILVQVAGSWRRCLRIR